MVEIKSIEQLIHYMKSHIHLSRYDEKFLENIATLKQVTTNQVILFHTLVHKYRRQFAKQELFVEKLVELPWNVTVVESTEQYTDGHISIEGGQIYFKCPFNRNFIEEFRKISCNPFLWDKNHRRYEADFSGYALKLVLTTSKKFFKVVHVCNIVEDILNKMKIYDDAKYWEPTLVERNGFLFVIATNQSLNDRLQNIELNKEAATLALLAGYGVTIDPSIYENTEQNRFTCEAITKVEQVDLEHMVQWLKDIKCDMVYLSGSTMISAVRKKIIDLLTDAHLPFNDTAFENNSHADFNFPVLIKLKRNFDSNYDPPKVSKIIYLVNSQPIEIK